MQACSRITISSCSRTKVWTGYLSLGGSVIRLMSFIPVSDIFSVLGIGVAESVNTSIFDLSCFNFSLCATPKRCSSSITKSPRSLYLISSDKSLCVPITKSMLPFFSPSIIFSCCLSVLNLESMSILNGKFENLSLKEL